MKWFYRFLARQTIRGQNLILKRIAIAEKAAERCHEQAVIFRTPYVGLLDGDWVERERVWLKKLYRHRVEFHKMQRRLERYLEKAS